MATKLKTLNWAKPEVKKFTQMILDGDRRGRLSVHQIFQSVCERSLELTTGREPTIQVAGADCKLIDEIAFAYQQAVLAEKRFTDILGIAYMELANHGYKKQLAQFFTPANVAKMMATISVGNDFGPRKDGRLHTAIDPASGSGVMMLSLAQHIFEIAGQEGLENYSFHCVDLDLSCALMSATQFAMNLSCYDLQVGELVVIRGDSLFPANCWELIVHAVHPKVKSAPIYSDDYREAVRHLSQERRESLFEDSQLAGVRG